MKAKVISFYGFSKSEVDRMPYQEFIKFWNCITPIEANTRLEDINIITFPHLKKDRQKKILQTLKQKAKKFIGSKKRPTYSSVLESIKRQIHGR